MKYNFRFGQVDLIFQKTMQPATAALLWEYLEPWMWMIPPWCTTLYLYMWDGETDTYGNTVMAETSVDWSYRRVELGFYTAWMDEPPSLKEQTVIHELVHTTQNLLFSYGVKTIDDVVEDESLRKHIKQQMRTRLEGGTQDLAVAIQRRYGKHYENSNTIDVAGRNRPDAPPAKQL